MTCPKAVLLAPTSERPYRVVGGNLTANTTYSQRQSRRGYLATMPNKKPSAGRLATVIPLLAAPWATARASFLSGETLDTAADIIAIVVLVLVPVIAIALFWLVHILPEKIAEQRQHPQKDAVKVLCLLSLVFGGLLWPLAWILAYTKPVLYKMAYGRDKHDDYYRELAESDPAEAARVGNEVSRLRSELDTLAAQGQLPPELQDIRERLLALEPRVPHGSAPPGGAG